jgi:hypothetical protein
VQPADHFGKQEQSFVFKRDASDADIVGRLGSVFPVGAQVRLLADAFDGASPEVVSAGDPATVVKQLGVGADGRCHYIVGIEATGEQVRVPHERLRTAGVRAQLEAAASLALSAALGGAAGCGPMAGDNEALSTASTMPAEAAGPDVEEGAGPGAWGGGEWAGADEADEADGAAVAAPTARSTDVTRATYSIDVTPTTAEAEGAPAAAPTAYSIDVTPSTYVIDVSAGRRARGVAPLRQTETRIAEDGVAYTKEQFVEFYGGTDEWDAAGPI